MTDSDKSDEPDWERKRRLAEIFGDALPEVTSDEKDDDPADKGVDKSEEWLKRQVPPHHGGA